LGSKEKVEVGTRIAVIGSPLGLEGTLSEGIVSGVREMRTLRVTWLQVSAAISPGSSGSPVLNAGGEVVGIATATFTEGQALNFAIPAESAKSLLAEADKAEKPVSLSERAKSKDPLADEDGRAATEAAKAGNYTEMLKRGQALVKQYPNRYEPYLLLAEAYVGLGFGDDAIKALETAVKINPQSAEAWRFLAVCYKKRGRYEDTLRATDRDKDVISAYHEALKIDPDDLDTWLALEKVCQEGWHHEEAAAAHNQVLRLRAKIEAAKPPPEPPPVVKPKPPDTPDVQAQKKLQLALNYKAGGMMDKAKVTLQGILKDFPQTKAAQEAKRMLDEMEKEAPDPSPRP
jgi:tetratricopeptide (TPR) repeat protein